MTKFKLGQKVFGIGQGEGVVIKIEPRNTYPIFISFQNDDRCIHKYTEEGLCYTNDLYPSLYESNPFENIFQERVMEVSDDGRNWMRRVVFYKKNDYYISWSGVETLKKAEKVICTVTWRYAREIQPESEIVELTMEDISAGKGTGVPSHLIRIKK